MTVVAGSAAEARWNAKVRELIPESRSQAWLPITTTTGVVMMGSLGRRECNLDSQDNI